jgi:hypothetical protein
MFSLLILILIHLWYSQKIDRFDSTKIGSFPLDFLVFLHCSRFFSKKRSRKKPKYLKILFLIHEIKICVCENYNGIFKAY